MATITLIIGKSGTGKSTSLRSMDPEKVALINVIGKPLPFKGGNKFNQYVTDEYLRVISAMKKTQREIIVIDDAGYLMTNQFMKGHSSAGAGNGVFTLYNQIGDNFWNLIEETRALPDYKRVYFLMHEEPNDFGVIKPKSIGKLVDDKVCLEGMFSIVLRSLYKDGKYIFSTQTDGADVAKSPMGLFESAEIDNDLAMVDKAIVDYYEIKKTEDNKQ